MSHLNLRLSRYMELEEWNSACFTCFPQVFLVRQAANSQISKLCLSLQGLLALKIWLPWYFNQLIKLPGIFLLLNVHLVWQSCSFCAAVLHLFGSQWEGEITWDPLQGNRRRLVYQISHFWQTAGCSFNNELPIIGMYLIQVNTHALNLLIGNFFL